MREAALDRLVFQYLQKRKFLQAQRAFEHESRMNDGTAAAQAQQMALEPEKGFVEDLLFYITADNDTAQYVSSFDKLAAWVDHSLDLYRNELSRVLYPVFLHCYLELVNKGSTADAHQLLSKYRKRFVMAGGQPSKVRTQELQDLQTVSAPEHLQTNRTAQTARSMRYPVRLCAYSFQLLTHFLHSAKLFLVLGMINERLAVEVVDGGPQGIGDEVAGEEVTLLTGHLQGDAVTANQQPLMLGLLKGGMEDKFAAMQSEKETEELPEVDAEGKPLTKKAKAAAARAAEKEKAKRQVVATERIEAEIPLPEASEEMEAALLQDLENRAQLSSEALPSAAFFTFVNTHQSLNCATFSADGAFVAGGFADSSVRIYDVERAASSRLKGGGSNGSDVTYLRGHSAAVYGLDYSTDHQLLYSGSADGTVRLWSTEIGANLAAYRGHNFPVWDVAANPHGHYFASASGDRTARVWCTERPYALRILAGHYTDVDVVRWHPNGHYLATGSSDRTVRLWDIRDGQAQRILIGHRAAVTSLAMSPDGKVLVSGDEDGSMIAWDLAGAKRLATLSGHVGPVWSMAFSQGEGSILASGGADETVRLWSTSAVAPPTAATAGAAAKPPADTYTSLKTFRTKATPVFAVKFTNRNLLLGSGALTLR
ncbi:hypothetical protein WJX72_003246 [[Myrmecia] bisecta]|uniref:TFIID subunit TAF5 NTD2 domain-containing protein n=1 Tax=[Myrmecia] bisecta TaxID=41462 RepID=A0AAW1R5S1_9CHLO